jgi:hypothetical protein
MTRAAWPPGASQRKTLAVWDCPACRNTLASLLCSAISRTIDLSDSRRARRGETRCQFWLRSTAPRLKSTTSSPASRQLARTGAARKASLKISFILAPFKNTVLRRDRTISGLPQR